MYGTLAQQEIESPQGKLLSLRKIRPESNRWNFQCADGREDSIVQLFSYQQKLVNIVEARVSSVRNTPCSGLNLSRPRSCIDERSCDLRPEAGGGLKGRIQFRSTPPLAHHRGESESRFAQIKNRTPLRESVTS